MKVLNHYTMMKVFITYADRNFRKSSKRIRREARALDVFDKILIYGPNDLPKKIKQSPLMRHQRGGGYWLWKPYIICETMKKYPTAIVVYADAGCTINKNYEEWDSWFKFMESTDTLLFQYRSNVEYDWFQAFNTNSVKILTWTKHLTVEYFNKLFNSIEWQTENKIWGGLIIAKNNSKYIHNVLEIMLASPELVCDPEGKEELVQHEDFCVHRHDQSIITPLAYWYVRNHPKIVKIIPETAESSYTAAVVASRLKDEPKTSLKTRVIRMLKSLLGESIYECLHFWK